MTRYLFAALLLLFAAAPAAAQEDALKIEPQILSDKDCASPAPYIAVPVPLEFTVTASGAVADAVVTRKSGDAAVDKAASTCAKRWKYVPASRDGVPVDREWQETVDWLPDAQFTPPVSAAANADCEFFETATALRNAVVRYTIKTDGSVDAVTVVSSSGDAGFDGQVADCVRGWRFTPALFKGKNVAATQLREIIRRSNVIHVMAPRPATPGYTYPGIVGRPHYCFRKRFYPPEALRLGHEGSTAVAFTIGTDGKVSDPHVMISSGFEELDKAALVCVSEWAFIPVRHNGEPAAVPWHNVVQWRLHSEF